MSGFLNLAVEGLVRLNKRGKFLIPHGPRRALSESGRRLKNTRS